MQRLRYFVLVSFFSLLVLGSGCYIYFLSSSRVPQIENTDLVQDLATSEKSSSEESQIIKEENDNNNFGGSEFNSRLKTV